MAERDRFHPSPHCLEPGRRTLLDRILGRPAKPRPSSYRISPQDVLIHPDLLHLAETIRCTSTRK